MYENRQVNAVLIMRLTYFRNEREMIQIEFSVKDKENLNHERFYNSNPRVRLKMEVLWLKSQSLPHKEICSLAGGISKKTLCSYLSEYKAGGIEALKKVNFYRPSSEMDAYQEIIKEHFSNSPPATLKEASSTIEELTGLKRGKTQVGKFLKHIGFKYRKTGMIPSKADINEQERFKNEELSPRIKEAEQGIRNVFFC